MFNKIKIRIRQLNIFFLVIAVALSFCIPFTYAEIEEQADLVEATSIKTAQQEKETPMLTQVPTEAPTQVPTEAPTQVPTEAPTQVPTEAPTQVPTETPTQAATEAPTQAATETPTQAATEAPTQIPKEVMSDSSYALVDRETNIYQRNIASEANILYTLKEKAVVFVVDKDADWARCAFVEPSSHKISYGYIKVNRFDYLSNLEAIDMIEKIKVDSNCVRLDKDIFLLPVEVSYPQGEIESMPTDALAESSGTTPTATPTAIPTDAPSVTPTITPSAAPAETPSTSPTIKPGVMPTEMPTEMPNETPIITPDVTPGIDCSWMGQIDELYPKRNIEVIAEWGDRPIELGLEVTLVANISGYEGLDTQVFWQVNRGKGWETIDESDSLTHAFTLDEENCLWQWRAGVAILPME